MERIGFVGLGIMGAAMARNLLGAGYGLVAHNRTRVKAEELAEHGAGVADSPREVAERSDIIITMLPGPPEVEQVVAGEDGLMERAREGSLIIDMSTSSPLLARELSMTARERERERREDARRPRLRRGRRGHRGHALDHGRWRRGRLRSGETPL